MQIHICKPISDKLPIKGLCEVSLSMNNEKKVGAFWWYWITYSNELLVQQKKAFILKYRIKQTSDAIIKRYGNKVVVQWDCLKYITKCYAVHMELHKKTPNIV